MEKGIAISYSGILLIQLAAAWLPIPVWAQMLPLTVLIIYIGAKNTTVRGEHAVVSEKMSTSDAYKFPIIGSVVLFSLYAVFKFLPKEYINLVVKAYFFVIGVLVLGAQISRLLLLTLPAHLLPNLTKLQCSFKLPSFNCCSSNKKNENATATSPTATSATTTTEKSISEGENINKSVNDTAASTPPSATTSSPIDEDKVDMTTLDVISYIISLVLGAWYIVSNHWSASNLFGIAFSIQGIESIALGSYFNGFVLLSGLFFYDIFWVFGTDVMVTVAKSFDAPIKLLFPQHGVDAAGEPLRPSLLGLGDIVIPGIYMALLLRFDHWLAEVAAHRAANAAAAATAASATTAPTSSPNGDAHTEASNGTATAAASPAAPAVIHVHNPPTPYFTSVMIWYFIGLLATLLVMYYFKAAQPALLYLVPACLISAFSTAARKGQIRELWGFDEGVPASKAASEKNKNA